MNLGQSIDKLWKLREAKRVADEKAKEAEQAYKEFESEVIRQMEENGTAKSSGKLATFSTKKSVVPTVKDWDKFYAYISRTKSFFLLQRRTSDVAVRELFESKGISLDSDGQLTGLKMIGEMTEKWGLEPFVKVTPHLTTLKN
jgi:hypothetical protein